MRNAVGTFVLLGLTLLCVACKTPDGPRYPIPIQDLAEVAPEGLSRIVLFNTSNRLLYFESGPIRIQLNGEQLPSIWLDHYIQAFVEPGEYELRLEHFDMFFWKGAYSIDIAAPEVYLEVFNSPTSTKYRRVERLPDDFHSRFEPGRDAANW